MGMWACFNESILPDMSRDSQIVCEWARAHSLPNLAKPVVEANDQMAATLAAFAVRVTGATGFYRGAGSAVSSFNTFGPVTPPHRTVRLRTLRSRFRRR
ncbi:DUF6882 domain-containing protein [Nocardia noduli]|uniref:DUF6882 domain-containing protein n=1 Tax=Nocardia noduli TaxID=2815722 RepID=UPI0034D5AD6D